MRGGDAELLFLVAGAGLGTYLCRALGVLLSGRIDADSELFRWVACVAYAMIAGLVSRILIMPTGILAETAFAGRFAACLLALAAYKWSRHNLLVAVATGSLVLVAVQYVRAF